MKVEDRLPAALADVDDDAVVVEALSARGVGDEVEHPPSFVFRKLADLTEARHVPFGKDE